MTTSQPWQRMPRWIVSQIPQSGHEAQVADSDPATLGDSTMQRMTVLLALLAMLGGLPQARPAPPDLPPGFDPLFNGKDLAGWKVLNGKMDVWGAENGLLFVNGKGGGWLMTEQEYED